MSVRVLIANFEFDTAYEGQRAKPAAAITMSMLSLCVHQILDYLMIWLS